MMARPQTQGPRISATGEYVWLEDSFTAFMDVSKQHVTHSWWRLIWPGQQLSRETPDATSVLTAQRHRSSRCEGCWRRCVAAFKKPLWCFPQSSVEEPLSDPAPCLWFPPICGVSPAFWLLGTASVALCLAAHFLQSAICMTAFTVVLCLMGVCLHEFAHAATAFKGGAERVAESGYLTCDLLRYLEPWDIVFSWLSIVFGGFVIPGARVYVDTTEVRSRGWRTAISLAGPIANLVLALTASFFVRVYVLANVAHLPARLPLPIAGLICSNYYALVYSAGLPALTGRNWGKAAASLLLSFVFLEAVSCFLNLVPLPPLDGWNAISPYISDSCWLKASVASSPFKERMCHLFVVILFYVILAHVPFAWTALAYSAAAVSGLPAQAFLPCMNMMMHPLSLGAGMGVDTGLLLNL
ncbi:hypothetical protein Efla_000385 [Eimeria flavescens]